MIAYDLKCADHGHAFEGWFGSSTEFEEQRKNGLLCCPVCGSPNVIKTLSAPNVGAKSNQRSAPVHNPPEQIVEDDTPEAEAPASDAVVQQIPIPSPQLREAIEHIAKAQAKMLEKSEWVGNKFTDEVRAQHYGEAEERKVHGEASVKDAQDLAEEGIDIMPVLFPIAPPGRRN